MAIRDQWYLPLRFRPDEMGHALPDEPDLLRTEDRQRFSAAEVARIRSAPLDYEAADKRWFEQYRAHVSYDMRRFCTTLALHLQKANLTFARAAKFYESYRQKYPGGISIRTLRTLANESDGIGLLSLDRGGIESGIEAASGREACLYFTSWQKYRLLLATGAVRRVEMPSGFVTFGAIILSGPDK